MVDHTFFAPCPRGLERVLAEELALIAAHGISPADGGVAFRGELATCYRANLCSRVASRVLWRIADTPYSSEDDIYRLALDAPWEQWFGPGETIRVNLTATRSPLRSLEFATLRIKDAVCDRLRRITGQRPSVDTRHPDVRIHAFLDQRHAMLYLDTSGDPLFMRGWRTEASDAPLRENLAAGILALSGWRPGTALLDPFCGGGTLAIEAAMAALGMPPGARRNFGFERLRTFDQREWDKVKRAAAPPPAPGDHAAIFGADRDPRVLIAARRNLAAAGLEGMVEFAQADIRDATPPAATGTLVANLPYGVRMSDRDDLQRLYPQLGEVLKKRFAGWTACLLTNDLDLPAALRLKPARRTPLYNGPLECRLFEFRMVEGSMRRRPRDACAGNTDALT